MSTPQRRSRRLALAAAAAAHCPLLDLPTDLLVRVLSRCDPADIARVAAVSLLFHASLALEGIRLWAQERGFELPAQPEDESCALRWLCFSALLCKHNPLAWAAAGQWHSLFIGGDGRLSSYGSTANWHSLAITADGAVWSWGYGGRGRLGHGDEEDQLLPKQVQAFAGQHVVAVSAGAAHSLALTSDGAVWSWGVGAFGRLGHGDEQNQLLPKKVEAFAGQRIVAVSAGGGHSLALTAGGALWSWGSGLFSRLGHGDDRQDQLLPKKIEALAGQRVVALSAGGGHSLALTAGGAVWSWGFGVFGKLGHGDEQTQLLPKKVEAVAGQCVVAVAAGGAHSCAITADGALWSWGSGSSGQLGHGDEQNQLLPKKVEAFAGRRVVGVSAGDNHSIALTADGAAWSWGDGEDGRLGHGDEQNQLLPKKVEAFTGQRVVAMSAGDDHSIALTADGAVLTWGQGGPGCLGHGEDLSNQLLPKKIEAWVQGQGP